MGYSPNFLVASPGYIVQIKDYFKSKEKKEKVDYKQAGRRKKRRKNDGEREKAKLKRKGR